MILLKHNIAESRRRLHQGAALARIQERNGQTAATTKRAATWQEETARKEYDRRDTEWKAHLDQAQWNLQLVKSDKEEMTRERINEHRQRADKAQAHKRQMQKLQEERREELTRDIEARMLEAEERSGEQLMFCSWTAGERMKRSLERVKMSKAAIENEKQRRIEIEFQENEERRQAGRDLVLSARQSSQQDWISYNTERFARHRNNVALQKQEEKSWQLEKQVERKAQAASARLHNRAQEVQNFVEQHAQVREMTAAENKARKEYLDGLRQQERLEFLVDQGERRQDAVDRRLASLSEAALRASRWRQTHARAGLHLEDEKREAMIQARAEMDEATALCEAWGWTVQRPYDGSIRREGSQHSGIYRPAIERAMSEQILRNPSLEDSPIRRHAD
mmetsp:Transcript_59778/g.109435  ORF Transcript_59778/g.109435 Transcript_59778/m.109435 type:complete len:394 (-) Transcript_59778:116-1297(-)